MRRRSPTPWSSSARPAISRTRRSFPSLQAMIKRGTLKVPVIGVAKAGWTLEHLKARAKDSLEKHGGLDPQGVRNALRPAALCRRRLQRPDDIRDPAQGTRRRQHPAHYLAIPPVLVRTRGRATRKIRLRRWRTRHRRKAVRPDLASAQNSTNPARCLRRDAIFSASTIISARARCTTCCSSALPIRSSSRSGIAITSKACRSPWRKLRRPGPRAFYDHTGAIRDVVQNHLLQVLTNLAMEPPARTDSRIDPRRKDQGLALDAVA